MSALPYVTAPGNIAKALEGIKKAATPPKITQDFVKAMLGIKGGSGNQIASFLKKIGFANADGTPSEIYKRFRNSATSGAAVAQAIRYGYAPLYNRNEYAHQLSDAELVGLIVEETGQADDASSVTLTQSAIKHLKKFADFTAAGNEKPEPITNPEKLPVAVKQDVSAAAASVGMNLSYTINLNLPATNDIAVFNAIFKSLKENLLGDADA
jgi:hypothetical protein